MLKTTDILQKWLEPSIGVYLPPFMRRGFKGIPGPIWTLLVWDLGMFVFWAINALALKQQGEDNIWIQSAPVYWFLSALLVLSISRRMPRWLLYVLVDLNIIAICVSSFLAPNDTRSAAAMMFLFVPALYAAVWCSRSQLYPHLAVMAVSSGLVVVTRGFNPDLGRVWIVVIVIGIGEALLVHSLVQHLTQRSMLDPLTGLHNRSALDALADTAISTRADDYPRSVVVMDLDGFKQVNDKHGHHMGDAVLRQVGAAIRTQLRPSDITTRSGGDEFIFVLLRSTQEQARVAVLRIVETLPIDCSYGIANWVAGQALEDAIKDADDLMYQHKYGKVTPTSEDRLDSVGESST